MHPAMVAQSVHGRLPNPLGAVSNTPTGGLRVGVAQL